MCVCVVSMHKPYLTEFENNIIILHCLCLSRSVLLASSPISFLLSLSLSVCPPPSLSLYLLLLLYSLSPSLCVPLSLSLSLYLLLLLYSLSPSLCVPLSLSLSLSIFSCSIPSPLLSVSPPLSLSLSSPSALFPLPFSLCPSLSLSIFLSLPLLPLYFLSPTSQIITGTYNNFFRIFDRRSSHSYTYEASRDMNTLGQILRNKKVIATNTAPKKRKDEVNVDNLDYARKILHPVWHPRDNILAIAATNNLYLFHEQQP